MSVHSWTILVYTFITLWGLHLKCPKCRRKPLMLLLRQTENCTRYSTSPDRGLLSEMKIVCGSSIKNIERDESKVRFFSTRHSNKTE